MHIQNLCSLHFAIVFGKAPKESQLPRKQGFWPTRAAQPGLNAHSQAALLSRCLVPDLDTAGPTEERCQTNLVQPRGRWTLWGFGLSCVTS